MKKLGLLCLTLCLFLTLFVNPVTVYGEEEVNKAVTNGASSIDGAMPLLGSGPLVENIESAILYETNSQTLMHAYNADAKIYPASLVKILTALIVAERSALSDTVTVKDSVLNTISEDALYDDHLIAGEVLTVEDLLHYMMVKSGNDAAAVLADYVCGSQTAFVKEMNLYAQELGCTQTSFTNVHGLHDEMQYTTVRDMTRILAKAMDNEVFKAVFGTVYYTIPKNDFSEERKLATGNFLMNEDTMEIYYDERVTGGRTGVTSAGYRSIATTAENNGMELICIITGAVDEYKEDGYTVKVFGGYNETSALLDSAFNGFDIKQIVFEGQSIEQYAIENGSCDVIVGSLDSVKAVLPSGVKSSDLEFRVEKQNDTLSAPISKGQMLTSLEVWYNNTCVANIDLYAMNSVESAQNQMVEIKERTQRKVWVVILIIIAVAIVLIVVAVIIINASIRARRKAERNRKRQYRRRSY